MKETNKENREIKAAFDKTFNVNTKLKRRRRNTAFKKKELFVSTITAYEAQLNKSDELLMGFGIDLNKFEEPFYGIIDNTLRLGYGEKIYELIAFYLYDRISQDGLINPLVLDMEIPPLFLETPDNLYSLIMKLYPEGI